MHDKKKTIFTSSLSLTLVLLLAGCGVMPGAVGGKKDIHDTLMPITNTPSSIVSPTTRTSVSQFSQVVVDFDGDGIADTASLQDDYEQEKTILTVTLGSGATATKEFPGIWDSKEPGTGDLNGDGKDDLLVVLEYRGSTYGACAVHVLYIEDSTIYAYPTQYIKNDSVTLQQPDNFYRLEGDAFDIIGASIVSKEGKDLLRVRLFLDKWSDKAQYVDARFNGEGWQIEGCGFTRAYGNDEEIPVKIAVPNIENGLPVNHREGFKEARLTFVKPFADGCDPDVQYYDSVQDVLRLSYRELAQIVLRQLYDLSGYQAEELYVKANNGSLFFSQTDEDPDSSSFFRVSFDSAYGFSQIGIFSILTPIGKASPVNINSGLFMKPDNLDNMSRLQAAKWYYENSTVGDRRAVVDVSEPYDHSEPYNHMVHLSLENGDFYEVHFAENQKIPIAFYGPYPAGSSH